MKLALLTTDTPHHTFFAWKLNEIFPIESVTVETSLYIPPFDTFHPFEKRRDEFEREELLKGFSGTVDDVARTTRLERIRNVSADVAVVFGTRKLTKEVISSFPHGCLNLHGGNPEHYRGLDSHLWTIYHRDFENLVSTLHHVDEQIDTGEIIFQKPLALPPQVSLHQLRSINTIACLEITVKALTAIAAGGPLSSHPQHGRGRYYSAMPAVLKEDCAKKFAEYASKL